MTTCLLPDPLRSAPLATAAAFVLLSNWALVACSAGGSGSSESGVPGQNDDRFPNLPFDDNSGNALVDDSPAALPDDCDSTLEVTYRDFSESHPDFEMEFSGDVVRRQLVEPELGPDRKPVFLDSYGCPALRGTPLACDNWDVDRRAAITSAQTFDQWYRDTPGANMPFQKQLELTETGPGTGLYVFNSNDFFPLGNDEGFGVTPSNSGRNFLFTTEIHFTFAYRSGQVFGFIGDDDLWIFVNGRLALDLGSMHAQEQGVIDFDAQAAELGIVPGRVYQMDIFHAERHTTGSNFGFETNIACFEPVTLL